MKLENVHRSVRLFPVLSVVKGFADSGAVETNDGKVPANLCQSLRCSCCILFHTAMRINLNALAWCTKGSSWMGDGDRCGCDGVEDIFYFCLTLCHALPDNMRPFHEKVSEAVT